MTSRGLVFKNLFRKKLRTFLTIFAILVAFAIFGVLVAFQNTLNSPRQGAAATRLVTTNKINFTQPLPYAYVEKIRAIPNVAVASHASFFGGYYQEPKNFIFSFAVDPETYLKIRPEIQMSAEARTAFLKDRTGILIGKSVADKYGWKPGDKIPLKSSIFRQKDGSDTWDFTVSGIYTNSEVENGDQLAIFHYDYYNESLAYGRDVVGQISMVTKDISKNDQTAQQIDAMFENSTAETETRTEAAFAASFAGQLGDIGLIITSVVGAAFVTILLIAGNTMMLTVRERTGEIAVLKTIGFTARRIFAMILSESMLLAFIGGALGIGLSLLGLGAINGSGALFGHVSLTPAILVEAFVLMVVLGLLTGLIPAWQAMRTDIVTAFGRK